MATTLTPEPSGLTWTGEDGATHTLEGEGPVLTHRSGGQDSITYRHTRFTGDGQGNPGGIRLEGKLDGGAFVEIAVLTDDEARTIIEG